MSQLYVYSDRIYFLCQAKDLCKLIQEYAKEYGTVKNLIRAKLN